MSDNSSFDPVWENKYQQGHSQRYPWDAVVSFVFRYHPRDIERKNVKILEVGCGTASNLWFAAREGFQVTGIDASSSAIQQAKERFAHDDLSGDFYAGDFTSLPFSDNSFDLVIDRAAITCTGLSSARKAVSEVQRVLKVGGSFFCNPYSDRHSSCQSGRAMGDNLVSEISAGTLIDAGHICFYDQQQITNLLSRGLKIKCLDHVEITNSCSNMVHAEWRAVAQKSC